MTYAVSAALQAAVFARLVSDQAVVALIGDRVFDALPSGPLPPLYVTLGAERVRDASDATGAGAWHDLRLSVITDSAGFQDAKQVAAAVSDALSGADLALSRGALVGLRFVQARATRETGARRRIDMTFRARVADD